jgi:hypothetical protein
MTIVLTGASASFPAPVNLVRNMWKPQAVLACLIVTPGHKQPQLILRKLRGETNHPLQTHLSV